MEKGEEAWYHRPRPLFGSRAAPELPRPTGGSSRSHRLDSWTKSLDRQLPRSDVTRGATPSPVRSSKVQGSLGSSGEGECRRASREPHSSRVSLGLSSQYTSPRHPPANSPLTQLWRHEPGRRGEHQTSVRLRKARARASTPEPRRLAVTQLPA